MGCVAPRTIQFVSGFGIIRLGHKGFALYNGVDDKLISEEVSPYIFGRDDIAGLNFNAINRSYAAQAQNPPLYICAVPVTGNTLTRVFIYDLVRRSWTVCDFAVPFQSLSLYITLSSQPVLQAGTSTGGQIVSLFNGATTDNGVAIPWSAQTRSYFLKSPGTPTYWRRAVIDMFVAANQTATVTTARVNDSASVSATQTFTTLGSGATLYGSAIYGTSRYGASGSSDVRQSFDILRTAPSVGLTITGTGVVRIRSIDLHCVSKRPTGVYV
jgi:hypothetical protein